MANNTLKSQKQLQGYFLTFKVIPIKNTFDIYSKVCYNTFCGRCVYSISFHRSKCSRTWIFYFINEKARLLHLTF